METSLKLDLEEQYFLKTRYRKKKIKLGKLFWLWFLTGLAGGHRYRLKQYKQAIGMSFTFAFAVAVGWFTWYLLLLISLFWWIHDLFLLKRWTKAANQQIYHQCIGTILDRRPNSEVKDLKQKQERDVVDG